MANIMRLAKRLPSRTDVNWGLKFHTVASSSTKVGTCKESIGIDVNTTSEHLVTHH